MATDLRLVIVRDGTGRFVCDTEPETWGYGDADTPEGAVADLRGTLVVGLRLFGDDTDWAAECKRVLAWLEGKNDD